MTKNDWEMLALVIKGQRNAPHVSDSEKALFDNLALQIVRNIKLLPQSKNFLPEVWLDKCR